MAENLGQLVIRWFDFLFLLYCITCISLYVVEVVKNSENIEINEKA